MNMLYCIRCEKMVKMEKGLVVGHIEYIPTNDYPPVEMDFCALPDGWATTPPSEIPEYWSDYVQDAQEDEMELSWIGAQDFFANLQ